MLVVIIILPDMLTHREVMFLEQKVVLQSMLGTADMDLVPHVVDM